MFDRIRLINVPAVLVHEIRTAISSSWGQIQDERLYYSTYEFKLSGYPWIGTSDEAVRSRKLLTELLVCMAQKGWNLVQASDVSKRAGDKDTLFFELSIVIPSYRPSLFSISFNKTDRIRVIDSPSLDLIETVKSGIKQEWRQGIAHEINYYGSVEFKLNGNPFWADGQEAVTARIMLAQILSNLRNIGYKLYGSVDISHGHNDGHDLESWVFRKVDESWP
ncbi:unnamed protein product [Didymodactylos carnosus]|uniref:Uncharacterized protein n=1 Tax=Didymodactylos carnosus TaxID=1234261 RepID=A0A814W6E0_9BILA|nr:unnamed protein product [Didymodactylos carnosus]CAF1197895.1 unnamed protein product [Didymodactylos carnosus]CAF3767757.1 unnamed protein product [Didymodactylos carnosus]CAF3962257.1 unnamed protein product [Didymodactylos carnosus]